MPRLNWGFQVLGAELSHVRFPVLRCLSARSDAFHVGHQVRWDAELVESHALVLHLGSDVSTALAQETVGVRWPLQSIPRNGLRVLVHGVGDEVGELDHRVGVADRAGADLYDLLELAPAARDSSLLGTVSDKAEV
jgi:hypothetical protein